jgi:hypothetical protein
MNSTATEMSYRLDLQGSGNVSTVQEALLPVLAADGLEVHDAIVEVPRAGLLVPGRSIRYFFITHEVPVGRTDIELTISNGLDERRTLKVSVDSIASGNVNGEAPKVLAWGYSLDSPIWSVPDKSAIVRKLIDDGVNVFVIHPAFIPVPSSANDWERKEKRFIEELKLYEPASEVLLYLGWDSRYGARDASPETIRAEVADWARRLSVLMVRKGYQHDQWAIYPFDEPDSHEFALLEIVASAVRSVDPKIRIYANPGRLSLMDVLPGGAAWSLRSLVNIWQPQLGIASKVMTSKAMLFLPETLWIYQTGAAPAKSIIPACYRKLGLEAASIGAAGIGVWSFSSINGNGAWDDFDGNGPDWAMVYEGDGEFIRSRRWEAFKSGIRDLRLLSSCSRYQVRGNPLAKDCDWLRDSLEREFDGISCYEVR